MNISEKHVIETIDYVVSLFRRNCFAVPSNADYQRALAFGRLSGIRLLCVDFPKLVALADAAEQQIDSILSGDVGRSSTQSPAAVE